MSKRRKQSSRARESRIRRGKRDKIIQGKKTAFLEAYEKLGTITHACLAAGITRQTHYDWLEGDSSYGILFDQAELAATDGLLLEARRRAKDGIEEPVIYQGKMCGTLVNMAGKPVTDPNEAESFIPLTVNKKSDILLMFMIKGKDSRYRDGGIDGEGAPRQGNTYVQFNFGDPGAAQKRREPEPRLLNDGRAGFDGRMLRVGGDGGES
jgi:hypothetical protein